MNHISNKILPSPQLHVFEDDNFALFFSKKYMSFTRTKANGQLHSLAVISKHKIDSDKWIIVIPRKELSEKWAIKNSTASLTPSNGKKITTTENFKNSALKHQRSPLLLVVMDAITPEIIGLDSMGKTHLKGHDLSAKQETIFLLEFKNCFGEIGLLP